MAQLAIYIEDQLAERLDKAAKASGKSKSRWVADAIKRSLQDQWPEGFLIWQEVGRMIWDPMKSCKKFEVEWRNRNQGRNFADDISFGHKHMYLLSEQNFRTDCFTIQTIITLSN